MDIITKKEEEYNLKYGEIPDEPSEILQYIEEKFKINRQKVDSEIFKINNLPWKTLSFSLPIVPQPSPRPRYSFETKHFYVRGAGENKKYIKKYINKAHIIFTRTELEVRTYQPTPTSSMNHTEIYLAELGKIRPIQNPDWDNLGKTYSDMIQGILLLNDNIITTGIVEKFFSIKPRVEIDIRYQDGFDSKFNQKRIERSTSYIKEFKKDVISNE